MKQVIKHIPTIYLRLVVTLIGLGVLALCVFALPAGIASPHSGGYRWVFVGMYVPAVPFFIALWQVLRLLHWFDRGKAFSAASVRAVQHIKYCAVAIATLYGIGMPYVFVVAQRDDAPGVVAIGLLAVFASMVIGVFAAVVQKVLESAIIIKAENDLTV